VEHLHVLRNRLCLTAAETELSAHLLIDTDVKLSEMDLVHDGSILLDSSLDISH
jgi:hypothetical protein